MSRKDGFFFDTTKRTAYCDSLYLTLPLFIGLFSAIRNPGSFYFSSAAYDWTAPHNNELWQDEVKTLFDPCPPGWRVPKSGEDQLGPWSSFSMENSTWLPDSPGRFWSHVSPAVWYPANGVRYGHNSLLNECGTYGYAWSSSLNEESSTYRFCFASSWIESIRTAYGYRAHGFSIRCVRE